MSDSLSFANKTALITGGTTGIGLATALRLQAGGAKVAVTGTNPTTLASARQALGERALVLPSDTANLADIDALQAKVQAAFGHLDLLFVNAGVAVFEPLEAVTEASFDRTLNINLKGAFFAVQRLLPLLQEGSAVVLNTSIVGEKGYPMASVYAASKAGLRSLARSLSAELVSRGIRVNAVSPGPITTPIYGKLGLPQEHADGFAAQMRESNPMKRFGTPDEVARAVTYLAFEATYTTGAELVVDGGVSQL